MQIKKGLCKIRKLYYTRLRECIGINRHVVVNLVLFFATCMYTVVWGYDVQCMQAQRTIQWTQESIYTGTKCTYKGPIVWAYGDTMHVQKNNPMRYLCVQRTNPMGIGCTNRGPTL